MASESGSEAKIEADSREHRSIPVLALQFFSYRAWPGKPVKMLTPSRCDTCECAWLASYSDDCPDCERRHENRRLNFLQEDKPGDNRERAGMPIMRATGHGMKIGSSLAGETKEVARFFQDFVGRWWRNGLVVSPNNNGIRKITDAI